MPKAKKQISVRVTTTNKKTKGRGASAPRTKNSMRSVIKNISSAVGGMTLGPMGARIGAQAGAYIARIMGQGDYKVNSNTLLTNTGPPSFATNGDDVIVKHRELVKDVTSSINFFNSSYLINPGNNVLFPWLSQIAKSFEEYEFLGLIVEYKSTSGSAIASTNNALGSVVISTDYNCENANAASKRAMETMEFSTSAGTDTTFIHPVECAKTRNVLPRQYVTSAVSTDNVPGDPRFYYLGNLQVATVGQQQSDVNIGELWVSYQVRLSRPVSFGLVTTELENDVVPSAHISYLLGNADAPQTEEIVRGREVFHDATLPPHVPFYGPRFRHEYSSEIAAPAYLFECLPQGEYLISCRWNAQGMSASLLEFKSNWDVINSLYPNSLTTSLNDSIFNNVARSSAVTLFDPVGYLSGEWNASASIRVYWKPSLWKETDASFPYVVCPIFHLTGSGKLTCDVSWSYISPLDSSSKTYESKKSSKEELKETPLEPAQPRLITIGNGGVDYEYVPTPRKKL